MTFAEFIVIFGFICSAIGALIGYFLNNKLAISRDKRKEFNALVDPMYQSLLSIRKQPSYYLKGTWEITFMMIREKLPFWKRKGFDRAIEAYKKSKTEYNQNRKPDGMGGFIEGDRSVISHAADNLLKYLKPR
jgi:hypothetical protein